MTEANRVDVAYGRSSVPIVADPSVADWEVIRPHFEEAIADPKGAFDAAVASPIGAPPIREVARPGDRVVIATSDGTRPVPNLQLIPWIVEALACDAANVTVLVGTGTHRPNTDAELRAMFGPDVVKRLRIVNHDAFDAKSNVMLGRTTQGTDAWLDRTWTEADRRIVVGFIEPHFFAGFSGGAKGVAPGVAGIDTILRLHRADLIGDPRSTWGVLEGNPIQAEIAEVVAMCPPDFMVNVTLNGSKRISGYYVGDYRVAHATGCGVVKKSSMQEVEQLFPVVVTSNSGYPLDQNLYQTVKGMSAAARIVSEGGTIVVASECSDGVPDHGNFAKIMRDGASVDDVLNGIYRLERPVLDQWQAQVLAGILKRARVEVYSELPPEAIRACKMDVTEDLDGSIRQAIAGADDPRVAVLPDGPLTIPYLANA
jgi:nickel-dependent lactate racemase